MLCQLFDDIVFYFFSMIEEYEVMFGVVQQGYECYLQLCCEWVELQVMLVVFSEFQLLCVLCEGLYGVSGVNEWLEQWFNCQWVIVLLCYFCWYDG